MDTAQYLDVIAADGAAMLAAIRSDPSARCTSCPDWDLAGLAEHVLGVYSTVHGIVSTRAEAPVPPDIPAWDGIDGLLDALETRHGELLEALRTIDPTEPVWTWAPDETAAFFHRRMAHETSVHRWDAQRSVGTPDRIAPELAADGVEEIIGVGLQHSSRGRVFSYPAGSLHLHRTDGPGEWMLVSTEPGVLTVTEEHGKGDAAVRGPAAGLYLYLWGRGRHEVEVFGDESVADAWARVAP